MAECRHVSREGAATAEEGVEYLESKGGVEYPHNRFNCREVRLMPRLK